MAAAADADYIVALPWVDDGTGADTDADADAEAELDPEGRRLLGVVLAYFPPHVSVLRRWVVALVRRRVCTQCREPYREVDNYALACRHGTHVLTSAPNVYYDARGGDFRGVWPCCGRPVDWRTMGCVRADHTDEPTMRRLAHDSAVYQAFPACLWYHLPHDNRSVSTDDALRNPTDDDIRRVYDRRGAGDGSGAPGSIGLVVPLRFDWRESTRRQAEARQRWVRRV